MTWKTADQVAHNRGMNFRRLSDSDELSPFEMNQLLDHIEQLSSTPPALDGTIGIGDGGQVFNLFPDEIVAQITSDHDGSLYGWIQCFPAAINADGTKGTTGPSPAGASDPITPSGTPQSGPAYEIKGRTDVPAGTRVFLRRSKRGPFYEFHYDGATYYGGSVALPTSATVLIPIYRYSCGFGGLIETSYTIMLTGPGLVGVIV